MRLAYADPPYLGNCRLYDHDHGNDGLCWDDLTTHKLLIERLQADYYDGWALSASSPSLQTILPLCPPNVRIAAWVKPFCVFKKGVRPAYAWEPVLFVGGRNPSSGYKHPPPEKGGKQTTPKDFVSANITLKKGLIGAKPEAFCRWILEVLNVKPEDTLVDLFPGTGVMDRVLDEMRLEQPA